MLEQGVKELTKEEYRKQQIEGAILNYVMDKYTVGNCPKELTLKMAGDPFNDVLLFKAADKTIVYHAPICPHNSQNIAKDIEKYWDYQDRAGIRRDYFIDFGGVIDKEAIHNVARNAAMKWALTPHPTQINSEELHKIVTDAIIDYERLKILPPSPSD